MKRSIKRDGEKKKNRSNTRDFKSKYVIAQHSRE